MNYFIHFGCWNNGGCKEGTRMKQVLDHIRQLTNPPKLLTVCGDNYYPSKTKNTESSNKELVIDDLVRGFDCLPNIPIYMNFGNHDYETNLMQNNVIENSCTIINSQQGYAKNNNIHLKFNQAILFGNDTQIIFLDTTIYTDKIDKYIQCYSEVVDTNILTDIKNIQQQFIDSTIESIKLNNQIKNIIIIGHHPIVEIKCKKNSNKFNRLSDEFETILYGIYSKLPSMKYYYLCADLHQYQSGNITIFGEMNIKQYIVGTAGAKKDDVCKDTLIREHYADTLTYILDENDFNTITDEAGYLTCTKTGDMLEFLFVTVESTNGGTRRIRRRKYPTKKRNSHHLKRNRRHISKRRKIR